MRPVLLCGLLSAVALCGCGPGSTQIRQYLSRSPHRALVIFPAQLRHGERDMGVQAAGLLAGQLRGAGFVVVDQRKSLDAYTHSTLPGRAFDELWQAADIARALGAKAVVLGAVDQAYERVERRPAEYRFDSSGRRRLVAAARTQREVGFALHLKVVDTSNRKTLWEDGYSVNGFTGSLSNAIEEVVGVLSDELVQAFFKQGL